MNYDTLIAVTNRSLCPGDFLQQIRKIAALHPHALILREKDLSPEDYEQLAAQVLAICQFHNVPCFLHSHVEVARRVGCRRIQLPLPALREWADRLDGFDQVSTSCHSLSDVEDAAQLGATQVLLGNIFATDCKKGLPGKGVEFLRGVCARSSLPVYAIGGVSPVNLPQLLNAGAAGGCMMSGFMRL